MTQLMDWLRKNAQRSPRLYTFLRSVKARIRGPLPPDARRARIEVTGPLPPFNVGTAGHVARAGHQSVVTDMAGRQGRALVSLAPRRRQRLGPRRRPHGAARCAPARRDGQPRLHGARPRTRPGRTCSSWSSSPAATRGSARTARRAPGDRGRRHAARRACRDRLREDLRRRRPHEGLLGGRGPGVGRGVPATRPRQGGHAQGARPAPGLEGPRRRLRHRQPCRAAGWISSGARASISGRTSARSPCSSAGRSSRGRTSASRRTE